MSILIVHVLLCVSWMFLDSVFVLFFFFFQAEDGIRDADVTGVQTCALPISESRELQSESGDSSTSMRDPGSEVTRLSQMSLDQDNNPSSGISNLLRRDRKSVV